MTDFETFFRRLMAAANDRHERLVLCQMKAHLARAFYTEQKRIDTKFPAVDL